LGEPQSGATRGSSGRRGLHLWLDPGYQVSLAGTARSPGLA